MSRLMGQLAAIIIQPEKVATMDQPKEWLAVSLVVLFVLTVSFAKGTIKADGALLDPMVSVHEREEHERHGHRKGQCR
jgi:hypothetical protein